jgi:hypothetical protein
LTTTKASEASLVRTVAIWRENFASFALISGIVQSPLIAYAVWVVRQPDSAARADELGFLVTIGGWILGALATGPMAFGVTRTLRGTPPGFLATLAGGLRRSGSILTVGFAIAFRTLMAAVPGTILTLSLLARPDYDRPGRPPAAGWVILGIATVLAGVVFVQSRNWVAVPAEVIERQGPKASIQRSLDLVRGRLRRIVGIVAVLFVLEIVLGLALRTAAPSLDVVTIESLRLAASVLVFVPLRAVSSAVVYHDLRVAREGISSEELTRVFD